MDTQNVFLSKRCKEAIIPTKRNDDAGYDFYVLTEGEVFKPSETKLLKTGLYYDLPKGYHWLMWERGSTGKANLQVRAGVCDNSFTGEVTIFLTNGDCRKYLILCKEEDFNDYFQKFIGMITKDEFYNQFKILKGEVVKKAQYHENCISKAKELLKDFYSFYPLEKAVCQGIITKVDNFNIVEKDYLDKLTDRGDGMVGSSGK